MLRASFAHLAETVFAVHRLVAAGTEGHLALIAAVSAGGPEHPFVVMAIRPATAVIAAVLGETVIAKNRPSAGRAEGHLALVTAVGTGCPVHPLIAVVMPVKSLIPAMPEIPTLEISPTA